MLNLVSNGKQIEMPIHVYAYLMPLITFLGDESLNYCMNKDSFGFGEKKKKCDVVGFFKIGLIV